MRPAITFDNQLSTGIQAFGCLGNPNCACIESQTTQSFGANPENMTDEQIEKSGNAALIGLVVFVVVSSILITSKAR
ncbi:hypothetical protein EBZ80_07180 [bacterium]|nr:hypothetical protein [bacterium]